jgi:hypothetical protein
MADRGAHPSTRCFPHTDEEFAREVSAAIRTYGDRVAAVGDALRVNYPQIRIVERLAWASEDGGSVWYCYRDGRPVPIPDGVGAMRAWTRIEALTNHSLDLVEWSAAVLRRSASSLEAAARAVARTQTRT